MNCHSFPPIACPDAGILVLGTMPGKRSLQERQYYAHPQNAFWSIVAEVLEIDMGLAYPDRVAVLVQQRIAVWDVLKSCTRESSLDSDIDPGSIVPNDFELFYATQPAIRRVCFNGSKAAALYLRHVRPHLPPSHDVEYLTLPSTSPANARISRTAKLRAWRAIKHDG